MANNKYIRSNFIQDQTINGVLEKDLVYDNWDLFKIKRPMKYYRITRTFLQRPDLLSLDIYGKVDYWWIISKVNQIDDWWNDLHTEDIIEAPDVRDIEDWYSAVKNR